jgi:hypothetical protein
MIRVLLLIRLLSRAGVEGGSLPTVFPLLRRKLRCSYDAATMQLRCSYDEGGAKLMMLVDGHIMLRLHEAAPLMGMTTRALREMLLCPGHGMTVLEREGMDRTIRFLRADEVHAATGGLDGGLLRQMTQAARGR